MPVPRLLPTAALLLGLLAPLSAVAQSATDRATDTAPPVGTEVVAFILEGGPVDFSPTPEEIAAATGVAATASAVALPAFTAYPNPAAERATVRFTLEAATTVRLSVYDLLGREVAVLAEGAMEPGTHETAFDGSRLAAGLYLVRLEAEGAVETQRLTLTQ